MEDCLLKWMDKRFDNSSYVLFIFEVIIAFVDQIYEACIASFQAFISLDISLDLLQKLCDRTMFIKSKSF